MKRKNTLALVGGAFFLLAAVGPAWAKCCQCVAADSSCSAAICCKGGCIAICARNDNCFSECASESTGLTSGSTTPHDRLVTIQAQGLERLTEALSQELEAEVTIEIDLQTEAREVRIEAQDFPAERLLELLSEHGSIRVGGERYLASEQARTRPKLDERISLELVDVSQEVVTKALSRALRVPVTFVADDPDSTISVEIKDMSVREALRVLSRFGSIEIAGEPHKPN